MIYLSQGKVEQEAKNFVRNWIRLLSQGKFEAALSHIDEPNQNGVMWTKPVLQKELSGYCRGQVCEIDNPDRLSGEGRASLVAFNDGSGYSYEFALPLNGCWSDLTVQFEFRKRDSGFAVILHDVHVL